MLCHYRQNSPPCKWQREMSVQVQLHVFPCTAICSVPQHCAASWHAALTSGLPCLTVVCCAVLRFIPADVNHLRDDVEELRKLFFRAKVPMQVCAPLPCLAVRALHYLCTLHDPDSKKHQVPILYVQPCRHKALCCMGASVTAKVFCLTVSYDA